MNDTYLAFGAPLPVRGRDSHGAVAVDGDAEHGVDGAQTRRVVNGQPQVAQQLSQWPVTHLFLESFPSQTASRLIHTAGLLSRTLELLFFQSISSPSGQ